MPFVGYSWVGILAATIAGYAVGSVWYGVLGDRWLAALGLTKADITNDKGKPKSFAPFIIAFVADLVMAFVLAGVMGHVGELTVRNGLITAAFIWSGFVITTLVVNTSFSMRSKSLIWIDGGHWLVVLLVMGAVIGGIGMR